MHYRKKKLVGLKQFCARGPFRMYVLSERGEGYTKPYENVQRGEGLLKERTYAHIIFTR